MKRWIDKNADILELAALGFVFVLFVIFMCVAFVLTHKL